MIHERFQRKKKQRSISEFRKSKEKNKYFKQTLNVK